ncbi:nitronate monooxygenase [Metabacillus sp. GX 13764]|uniref:NAD(P)H-dependent flavin oxidoreductase n=1 Tax=Metabacillus kandeliae TaxID=2900151 RepID=UPI001E60B825|nr:nitronate monooxygenase [Metabacillus kandeliae]MCD7033481.1 nitronate monooxygenase [Metabacillus kandeliae]
MMQKSSVLCSLLGIQFPVIQAGMAGGPAGSELAAAVSKAGGLGTLGAAYMSGEAIREAVKLIREKTDRPFAVNLFTADMKDDFSRIHEVKEVLAPIAESIGAEAGFEGLKTKDMFLEQFQAVMEENVPIISTAFGLLPEEHMAEAKNQNRKIIAMATTVEEAISAERSGADAVVAQGSDAGGHRGTFDMNKHPQGANIGTFSLVPQMADALAIPVIAAGGVMDGRGLAASLMLGASGVQLGTRFLACAESGAHPAYQEMLTQSNEASTVLTSAFSGRPARGISNQFISSFELSGVPPLPFPSQNTATGKIRKAAAEQNNPAFMSLWAGQGLRMMKYGETAEDILLKVMKEAEDSLASF